MITGNITIKSENSEYGIETNADSMVMDANNNQKSAFNAKPYITSSGVKSYLSGLSSDIPFYFCYKAFDKSDNEISLQNTNKKYGTLGADVVSDSPYEISIEDSELSGKVSYLKLILSVNNSIVYTKIIYLNRDLPIVISRSEVWSSGLTFNNGNLIISDNVVYQWNYPHAGNSAVNPTTDITNNPTTTHWVAYQQWTLLATKVIMAAFAMLGGAVFSGDYMFSQQGVDAGGNATSDYSGFTNESGTAFQPNILINFLTGLIRSRKGEFIDATIKDCKGIDGVFSRIEALSDDGYSQMLLTANLIRFLGQYSSVFMGGDTTPSSGGGVFYVPLRVSVDRNTTGSINANIGALLSAKGASAYDDVPYSGNHALYITDGDICGLRLRTRRISTSQTLDKMDTRILCLAHSAITVTLPSGCEDGQMYIIRIMNGKAPVTIAPASGTVCWNGTVSTSTYFEDSCTRIVIYDKVNNQWSIGTSAV